MKRMLIHLAYPSARASTIFDSGLRERITRAIADSEARHTAQIRFAVEANLSFADLWRGVSARERAIDVFSELRVWDTAGNNGVLIYLLLADRDVEIVADRAFNDVISGDVWESVCQEMEGHFAHGDFDSGALEGIARVGAICEQHAAGEGQQCLPDEPVML